uniref:Uncharacterized protein n=1 Tax=Siphoviridae sp. ctSdk10 TaxID=2826345 RepID=A0A8S5MKI3_9CAUD|nr:MAG TPA: hypothetical protein [Siphoviridae sp. ctSdk10]
MGVTRIVGRPRCHTYCWTFPWNCNERSGWTCFWKIIYLIDDDDF